MKKIKNSAAYAIELLKLKGLKIAFAESCTGGILADAFVSVSGASEVFLASLVCYGEAVKKDVLGVSAKTIKAGVVSKACAAQMAKNAIKLLGSDLAISTTGYAEKSEKKDIADGTVFIALAHKGKVVSEKELHLKGKRNKNRKEAALEALEILIEYLDTEASK